LLLTGATGLLGGAVLHEQLKRISRAGNSNRDRVVLLVRARDQEHAIQRIVDQLSGMCELEHMRKSTGDGLKWNPQILAHSVRQLVDKGDVALVTGDLRPLKTADERSWRDDPRLQTVTHVLDVAASTYFSESRYDSESTRHGSHQLLHALLQARAPLTRFVHCGTAWSCGSFGTDAATTLTADNRRIVAEIDSLSVPPSGVRHLVPYALDKLNAEQDLVTDAARHSVPLVVARPSICFGHTVHGCAVTQSIFWAVRLAASLRALPFDVQRTWFDFVPIDWTARALLALGLDIEQPMHTIYHLSAGRSSALRWSDLIATIRNCNSNAATPLPECVSDSEFAKRIKLGALSPEELRAIGTGDAHTVLRGFRYYVPFAQANIVFDNERQLSEAQIERLPDMLEFVRLCNKTYGDVNNKESQQEDI